MTSVVRCGPYKQEFLSILFAGWMVNGVVSREVVLAAAGLLQVPSCTARNNEVR